jgi:hypothetical protein
MKIFIYFFLKEYHQTIEQFKYKEQISDEKIRILEEQLIKIKAEEKAQRLKFISLTKQMSTKRIHSRRSVSSFILIFITI